MLLYFFVDEESTISQEQLIEEIFEKMWRFVNVMVQYYPKVHFLWVFLCFIYIDSWAIPLYTIQKHCIFIFYHAIENTDSGQHSQCNVYPAYEGKVGRNTVKSTEAFLYSDCMHVHVFPMACINNCNV